MYPVAGRRAFARRSISASNGDGIEGGSGTRRTDPAAGVAFVTGETGV
jgi:hypothetical protein